MEDPQSGRSPFDEPSKEERERSDKKRQEAIQAFEAACRDVFDTPQGRVVLDFIEAEALTHVPVTLQSIGPQGVDPHMMAYRDGVQALPKSIRKILENR